MWINPATWLKVLRLNKRWLFIGLSLLLVIPAGAGPNWFRTQGSKEQFNRAVEQYNAGHYSQAEAILKKLLVGDAGHYASAANLLLMKTNYREDHLAEAKRIGRNFLQAYPTSKYRKDVFVTFGDIFVTEGMYPAAYRMYLQARGLGGDPDFQAQVDRRILRTLKLNIPVALTDEMLALISDPTSRAILFLTRAYSELYDGNPDECAFALNQIDPDVLPTPFYNIYEPLLLASYRPAQATVTFGVVVPLSGKNRELGQSFLQGVQAAVDSYPAQDRNISFLVYDNRSREIETVRAVRSLAHNPRVLAVLGPLDTRHALLAATTLMQTRIPILLPFTVQDGLTSLGDHIFQLNSNLEIRGRLAARYAVQRLGLNNIAVLAPADEFGQDLVDAFVRELDRQGVAPVAVEWYSGVPQNLSRQFKALRRVAWDLQPAETVDEDLLGMEIDSLDAMFDISVEDFFEFPELEEERPAKVDSSKVPLTTIEALYLPVHPEHLTYLGTQFPLYSLKTQLLGNEYWQNLDVLNQDNIGPHVDSLIIITDFFVKHRIDRGLKDPVLRRSFYHGYDSSHLLLAVLASAQPSREAVIDRLSSVDEFRGYAQYFSFAGDIPNLNTALQVVQYRRFAFKALGYFRGDSLVTPYTPTP
jgi:hypothetical protein